MCKWCKWVLVWGWVLIRCWLFHCGFVDGCFIADEYFFASECFCGLSSEGGGVWFDWVRGWFGVDRRCSYARAYTRSRTRSFLLSQVSQWMELKILHHPQNDVSFYRKWRVVLLKTTCRFIENIVSFYRKQRVVLWKVTGCFGSEVEKLFWGWCFGEFLGWSSSVKVWYFFYVVSVIGVNGY